MPNCGALTIAYRSADDLQYDDTAQWEFTCSRCGIEFTVPKDDLVFRSVPTQWTSALVNSGVDVMTGKQGLRTSDGRNTPVA